MSALAGLHFIRPWWLLALPLLWALAAWLARRQSREGDLAALVDADLLRVLRLEGGDARGGASPWPWLALAWSLAVLALAGPSWQRVESPGFRAPAAWVLVLDLSPSMAATDVAPDRVTRARYALDDLLSGAHDARVGLVVFSQEPYTVTPLTQDVATVRALLDPLSPDIMPSAGDALAPALEQAGQLLDKAGTRDRRIVVLTDGFDDPAAAFSQARQLAAKGIDISVVGIGTAAGAPLPRSGGGFVHDSQGKTALTRLDSAPLQELARAGGGRYTGLDGLQALIGSLQSGQSFESAAAAGPKVKLAHWRDAGVWLLPLTVLAAAGMARKGWL